MSFDNDTASTTVIYRLSAHGRLYGEAFCTYNAYTQKKGVGAYTEMGAYSGEYGNYAANYYEVSLT